MASAILVLGVGNLLLRDEGLGVHAVRLFAQTYAVSPNVRVLDGGTAGVGLLNEILACDHLIVADVARLDAPPGTIARLQGPSLARVFKAKQSAHDWGLGEVLLQANLVGHAPAVVVVAVEPDDMTTFDLELSPCMSARLPAVVACLAAEVEAAGGRLTARLAVAPGPT